MQLEFTQKPQRDAILLYPVIRKQKIEDKAVRTLLSQLSAGKEFSGQSGQLFFRYPSGFSRLSGKIIFVGLGSEKKLTVASVMSALGSAVKAAASHHPKTIAIIISPALAPFMEHVGEAIVLASFQPAAPYKSGKAAEKLQKNRIEKIEFVGSLSEKDRHDLTKGVRVAETVNRVRDAVNAPPNFADTEFFEDMAKAVSKASGASLTILKKKQLEKLGMRTLLAVNRGSPDEARVIILDYKPKGFNKDEAPIVLVGKGILFDSGGYNLKPRGHIEDMQLDKAGATVVLALVKLLPLLGIKKRVIAVAPFTENLIGSKALKPSEIIKTYSGKTVEITNTDGEGRLVLCDAIGYAIDTFKPKFLIDVATLTGACMVALGDRYAGLFGNDEALSQKLRTAGDEVDELLWPMPIHKDDAEKMKGHYADLRNADLGTERYSGASKGAAFIQEFVGKTPWIHLDIAGPAFTNDPKKYDHKGATGFGVRVLARFLEKLE